MVCLIILSLLAILWVTISCKKVGYLPDNIQPENYNLEIITNLDDNKTHKFIFEGKVVIRIKCLEPTDIIILNAVNLTIHEGLTLNRIGDDQYSIYVTDWCLYTAYETMDIKFNKPLTTGHTYDLTIRFTGNISNNLVGYYRSNYVRGRTKEIKWLAVTNFEPVFARRAFPCFDEPKFKATFKISLGRLAKYSSLSNMPLERTEPMKERKGWFWDRYKKTVRMPTYLTSYVVSDFNSTLAPKIPENNVIFRIWCKEDSVNYTDLAAEIGPKALAYFEEVFTIKYSLPKQDMIAIPQFEAGAMENWGLITYRESALLFNPQLSTFSRKLSIANTITHELAHQWFGNLVTMKWWNDLWLNEGFATYLEAVAVRHLFPEWNTFDEAMATNMLSVFYFEIRNISHPVSADVETPSEIVKIFDTISYLKGSCLVYMMVNILGEDTFRKGIIKYLEEHKYKNVEQDDLFESLTIEAHKTGALDKDWNMKTIMDTWTLQTGYPVVTVNRSYDDNSVMITQEKYVENSNALHKNECWWIPLSYTNQKEKKFENMRPKSWLLCPPNVTVIKNISGADEWVIFNIRASGLYRVNYDDKNWEMLASTLKSDSYADIPLVNRVQLVDDSFTLANTNKLNYNHYFEILRYLEKETEYFPWKRAHTNIQTMHNMLRNTSTFESFKKYMKAILDPSYKRIEPFTIKPNDREKSKTLQFKSLISTLACKYDSEICINETNKLFNEYMNNINGNSIPVEFRSVVYCNGIKKGSKMEWDFMWEKYTESQKSSDKQTILQALSCTKNASLLEGYLEWTLDESSGLRKEDRSTVFLAVVKTDVGFPIAKKFFQNNFQKIFESLKINTKMLLQYLNVILEQVTTSYEKDQFKELIDQRGDMFPKLRTNSQKLFIPVERNIQWQISCLKDIEKYFQNS